MARRVLMAEVSGGRVRGCSLTRLDSACKGDLGQQWNDGGDGAEDKKE